MFLQKLICFSKSQQEESPGNSSGYDVFTQKTYVLYIHIYIYIYIYIERERGRERFLDQTHICIHPPKTTEKNGQKIDWSTKFLSLEKRVYSIFFFQTFKKKANLVVFKFFTPPPPNKKMFPFRNLRIPSVPPKKKKRLNDGERILEI